MLSRLRLAEACDTIIPGHGHAFKVTARHREKLREDKAASASN